MPEDIIDLCRLYFETNVATDPLLSLFGHRNYDTFKDEILHFLTFNNPAQYIYLDETTKRLLTSVSDTKYKWPDLLASSGQAIEMKTVYRPPRAAPRIASVVRDIVIQGAYTDNLIHVVDSSPTQNALDYLKPIFEEHNMKYTLVDHSITKPIVKDSFEVIESKFP